MINIESIFPLITTTLSFMFFLSVSEQYIRKRKMHQLIWAIAMFFFFITAGAEFLALLLGTWNPLVYRFYYIFAAIQVAFMGGGVFYLLADRGMINERNVYIPLLLVSLVWVFFSLIFSFANPIFNFVLVPALVLFGLGLVYPFIRGSVKLSGTAFSNIYILFTLYIFIFIAYQAFISQLNLDYLSTGGEVSGLAWQLNPLDKTEPRAAVRLFSPLFTVTGAIGLIGGAFYSYFAWQRSIKSQTGSYNYRTGIFNLYIAFGALALSAGGALSGFGFGMLYVAETISVSFMYFGFLESDKITLTKLVDTVTLKFLRKSNESALNI